MTEELTEKDQRKTAIDRFSKEAKERGFTTKFSERKYKNDGGDVFELTFFAPYTIKIKYI